MNNNSLFLHLLVQGVSKKVIWIEWVNDPGVVHERRSINLRTSTPGHVQANLGLRRFVNLRTSTAGLRDQPGVVRPSVNLRTSTACSALYFKFGKVTKGVY
jgi:hypothetical protein